MNQFGVLPQNLPRTVEAQSARSPSAGSDNEARSGGEAETGGFDLLLKGFAKGANQDNGATSGRPAGTPAVDFNLVLNADEASKQNAVEADLLESLKAERQAEEVVDGGSSGLPDGSKGEAILSLLQGILPQILPHSGAKGLARSASEENSLSSSLAVLQPSTEADDLLAPGGGARLRVSVQNQETHFKPVVEGFNISAQPDGTAAEGEPQVGASGMPGQQDKIVSPKNPSPNSSGIPIGTQLAQDVKNSGAQTTEEQNISQSSSAEQLAEGVEVKKNATAAVATSSENAGMPPATLQRIAGAVASQVRLATAELGANSSQGDLSTRLSSTRAPEGVLRVLDLQLEPVELGLVTIKIKLSGERLEMELRVESEETANLLRQDSEKLSALLRGSGYRPEVITIQSGDSASQERFSAQREQTGSYPQGQSFQQNTSGQDEQSRQQHGQFANERTGVRNDANEDSASDNRSSGGVYL